MKTVLKWSARILGIAFTALTSVFALDVFSEGYGFFETILALFIHLLPTQALLIALIVGWQRPVAGGIMFIAVSVLFFILFWQPGDRFTNLIVPGLTLLVGFLFLFSGIWKSKSEAIV